MKMKHLLKKAFLLLALVGGVNSAWAADTVIFNWKSDGSSVVGTSMSASGGSAVFGGASDKLSTESASYNASVTDDDLKATSSKGHKLGGNAVYLKATLTSNVLQEGDIIYVCGYNAYRIGSEATGDNRATTDIASELATGTSKSDYQVGSVTITASMITAMGSEVKEIYFSRKNASGTGLAAIKIVRPDQSKKASDLTLTSDASVTLDPEATSQISYTSSSTGAVTYSSSAEGVATVSSTGLITAVAFGSATITINQAADETYNAGSKTVTVNVNKVRKPTEVTGEFILDTTNGSLDGKVYTSKDGSVIIECGTAGVGSNTYFDNKNSHYKSSGDCLITLPTNYSVSTIQYVGYSNSDSDRDITLKQVDGIDVEEQKGTILKRNQIPATDCVGFELETPATESIKINIASECRGYFILNPEAKNITMNQIGTQYYATFYSAGEVTITGATAYTAEFDAENSKLILTECMGGVVGGRTGVILIGNSSSATATPSFTGATKSVGDLIGVAEKAVAMANYYAGSASAAGKVFVLGNDEGVAGFYKYTGSSLGVNKAYLYNELLGSSEARSITFSLGSGLTSVNGVSAETVKKELKKFFEKGQLIIEKEGNRFNAAGQLVK